MVPLISSATELRNRRHCNCNGHQLWPREPPDSPPSQALSMEGAPWKVPPSWASQRKHQQFVSGAISAISCIPYLNKAICRSPNDLSMFWFDPPLAISPYAARLGAADAGTTWKYMKVISGWDRRPRTPQMTWGSLSEYAVCFKRMCS